MPEYSFLAVKLQPSDISAALESIEAKVRLFAEEPAFAYRFLDESFRGQYENKERLGEVFGFISFLAIFIACLDLFGLAAFTTEQRTKEIGIRKVLGASIMDVILLLSRGITRLILIAVIVAVPLSYFATESWLSNFAYRIDFKPATFAVACLLLLVVALLTMSFQTLKTANYNPTDSFRYE